VSIRPLESSEDFDAFEDLQREVWGQDLSEVVTASLAKIVQKIGGIAAGAFDARGRMIGFVFGFTGFSNGRPVHWSHMLAVKTSDRDTGIGRRLKLYQRTLLLQQGIKEVYWTYDPLVARNAHLNLNSLGVEVSEYVPDMYGPGEDSELFRGIGTDRFIVVWRIDSDHVEKILGGIRPADTPSFKESPLAVSRAEPANAASVPQARETPRVSQIRIEIPPDIHVVRDGSPANAAEWRRATRRAFLHYLGAGYQVSAFYRDEKANRCFYCLRTKTSG
jgi:predicted GNAT superfamily acetyltransferase